MINLRTVNVAVAVDPSRPARIIAGRVLGPAAKKHKERGKKKGTKEGQGREREREKSKYTGDTGSVHEEAMAIASAIAPFFALSP